MSSIYCSACDRIITDGFFDGHDRNCSRKPEDITLVLPGETIEQVRQRSHVNRRHSVAMLIASVIGGLYVYSQTREPIAALVGATVGVWIGSTKLGSQLVLWASVIAICVFLWQLSK